MIAPREIRARHNARSEKRLPPPAGRRPVGSARIFRMNFELPSLNDATPKIFPRRSDRCLISAYAMI
jgi:hypothetical protein